MKHGESPKKVGASAKKPGASAKKPGASTPEKAETSKKRFGLKAKTPPPPPRQARPRPRLSVTVLGTPNSDHPFFEDPLLNELTAQGEARPARTAAQEHTVDVPATKAPAATRPAAKAPTPKAPTAKASPLKTPAETSTAEKVPTKAATARTARVATPVVEAPSAPAFTEEAFDLSWPPPAPIDPTPPVETTSERDDGDANPDLWPADIWPATHRAEAALESETRTDPPSTTDTPMPDPMQPAVRRKRTTESSTPDGATAQKSEPTVAATARAEATQPTIAPLNPAPPIASEPSRLDIPVDLSPTPPVAQADIPVDHGPIPPVDVPEPSRLEIPVDHSPTPPVAPVELDLEHPVDLSTTPPLEIPAQGLDIPLDLGLATPVAALDAPRLDIPLDLSPTPPIPDIASPPAARRTRTATARPQKTAGDAATPAAATAHSTGRPGKVTEPSPATPPTAEAVIEVTETPVVEPERPPRRNRSNARTGSSTTTTPEQPVEAAGSPSPPPATGPSRHTRTPTLPTSTPAVAEQALDSAATPAAGVDPAITQSDPSPAPGPTPRVRTVEAPAPVAAEPEPDAAVDREEPASPEAPSRPKRRKRAAQPPAAAEHATSSQADTAATKPAATAPSLVSDDPQADDGTPIEAPGWPVLGEFTSARGERAATTAEGTSNTVSADESDGFQPYRPVYERHLHRSDDEAPPRRLAPTNDWDPATTSDVRTESHPGMNRLWLEARLDAAELELYRVERRTNGEDGDLRNARQREIANAVRLALGDTELATHFEFVVEHGRFAFQRRGADQGTPMETTRVDLVASTSDTTGTTSGRPRRVRPAGPVHPDDL